MKKTKGLIRRYVDKGMNNLADKLYSKPIEVYKKPEPVNPKLATPKPKKNLVDRFVDRVLER